MINGYKMILLRNQNLSGKSNKTNQPDSIINILFYLNK